MTAQEKEWILGLPKEMKLKLLKDSLKDDKFGIFIGLTKIFLDAPISKGGISTEEIEEVQKEDESTQGNWCHPITTKAKT